MNDVLMRMESAFDAKITADLGQVFRAARDALSKKEGLPAHEVRQRLLDLFVVVFATGKAKLTFIAIDGLQMLLRDASLHTDRDACRVADASSAQILRALEPLALWSAQIQPHIFTIIVQLISNNEFHISIANLFDAMQLCFKVYGSSEDSSVKLAIRAALTQMLNSYCLNRQMRITEAASPREELAALMDMTTLLNEILPRLSGASVNELQLTLDALYSIISVLPALFHRHVPLLNLFRNEIIPALVCLLLSSSDECGEEPKKSGVARLATTTTPAATRAAVFATPEIARSFYQVVEQLLILFSDRRDDAKLILELYRSALLVTPVSKRFEAIKLIKRMVLTPQRLVLYLSAICEEPMYWLILMECLEECAKCAQSDLSIEAIHGLNSLFSAFFGFFSNSNFTMLPDTFSRKINQEFAETNESPHCIQIRRKTNSKDATQAASIFVNRFEAKILELLNLSDVKLADELLQKFAVEISKEFSKLCDDPTQFNATAIYLTSYAALDLMARLHCDPEHVDDFEAWLTKIFFAGICSMDVCVDRIWLADVYELILSLENPFQKLEDSAVLEQIIDDYKDIFSYELFSKAALSNTSDTANNLNTESMHLVEEKMKKMAEKWLRNTVASCWSSVLTILTRFSLKDAKKAQLMSGTISPLASIGVGVPVSPAAQAELKTAVDGARATLQCMHSLLELLIRFNMNKEIVWLYERLGEEVCELEELRRLTSMAGRQNGSIISGSTSITSGLSSTAPTLKKPWLLLNRNDAFALATMLHAAIRHADRLPNTVWKYVVRCVEYVSELERYLFQTRKEQAYDPRNGVDEETVEDPCDALLDLPNNELSSGDVNRVLDRLLLKIDRFFDTAPKTLSLSAICALITTLIATNEDNLNQSIVGQSGCCGALARITSCVLLQRVAQLVAGVANRPFIYALKTWHCARDHFVETAFSKYPDDVTKMAICCIYDCAKAFLRDERPNEGFLFRFNATLFQAFQTVLCGDAAKPETQEHIVSILSAFVDERAEEIGTGWRPLFGMLKSIQVSGDGVGGAVIRRPTIDSISFTNSSEELKSTTTIHEKQLRLSPVHTAMLDLFRKFLNIKSPKIIYSSLLDYIHCIFGYLRCVSITILESEPKLCSEEELEMSSFTEKTIALVVFTFIEDVQKFLFELYEKDPSDIRPSTSFLISLKAREKMNFFAELDDSYKNRLNAVPDLVSQISSSFTLDKEILLRIHESTTAKWDSAFPWQDPVVSELRATICELFLALTDHLCGLVSRAPPNIYAQAAGALVGQFTSARTSKIGPKFGVFTLYSSVLPTLIEWAQRAPDGFASVVSLPVDVRNFKQSAGTFIQLIVDYMDEFLASPWCVTLLDAVLVLLERLVASPSQFISGIGCSCLRHLCLSASHLFTYQMWQRVAVGVWRAIYVTLIPIRVLISQFFADSEELCGDMGELTVAIDETARSLTAAELDEFAAVARRVFLISSIHVGEEPKKNQKKLAKNILYVFLLKKPNETEVFLRITLANVILCLHNHQTLVGAVDELLNDSNGREGRFFKSEANKNPFADSAFSLFLIGLHVSAYVSDEFNQRPALKFLLQKLSGLDEVGTHREASCVSLHNTQIACRRALLAAYLRAAIVAESPNKYADRMDALLDTLLDALERAEQRAAAQKLAAFAREKFLEPIEFSLVESDGTLKLARKIKNSRKKIDQACNEPTYGNKSKNFDMSAFEAPVTNQFVNPFKSTSIEAANNANMIEKQDVKNQQELEDSIPLANFISLDMDVLAYSEVLAGFLDKATEHLQILDSQKRKKFLADLFPRVSRYLIVTGNARARCAVAHLLDLVRAEFSLSCHKNSNQS